MKKGVNASRNRKFQSSTAPTKAKSREPAYSQVLNQNKINRHRVKIQRIRLEDNQRLIYSHICYDKQKLTSTSSGARTAIGPRSNALYTIFNQSIKTFPTDTVATGTTIANQDCSNQTRDNQ